MPTTICQKLRIKEGYSLLTINAPAAFVADLKPIPTGVQTGKSLKKFNQIHWFVETRAQLEKELDRVLPLIGEEITCWIYYPKGSSGIQTDLTRDKGWEQLLKKGKHLVWISLISLNDTWSTFGLRLATTADVKKKPATTEREIFNWVNPTTKSVKLPDDVKKAFVQHKKEAAFFEQLSFTNKKEYLEWIVTAKQSATREERIKGTITRLSNQWKNPRNL